MNILLDLHEDGTATSALTQKVQHYQRLYSPNCADWVLLLLKEFRTHLKHQNVFTMINYQSIPHSDHAHAATQIFNQISPARKFFQKVVSRVHLSYYYLMPTASHGT